MLNALPRFKEISTVENFLNEQECHHLIENSEKIGYEKASITTIIGQVMMPHVRNNTRVMVDDPKLAEWLFERARPLLPESLSGGWQLVGLNERLRYYRYDPGQKFAPHYDGYFERNRLERSHLTFMIYLNDGFEGGETKFLEKDRPVITPKQGSALIFVHRQLHEGAALLKGRKYVLRTDVMYRRSAD